MMDLFAFYRIKSKSWGIHAQPTSKAAIVNFYRMLGDLLSHNRLTILPDLTHYEAFQSTRMAEAALKTQVLIRA